MKLLPLSMCAVLALALAGCETMDNIGKSVQNIRMPSFGSAKSASMAGQSQDAIANGANGMVAAVGVDCPQVKALTDLSSISQFANPEAPSAAQMIATTVIDNIGASCQVSQNSVTIELALDFTGTLGPVGLKDLNGQANYTYPYFLTVITPDGQILSKDVFALSMVYEKNKLDIRKQDKLRQVIPLMGGQNANQFQIVVGFQLSDAELAYNRSGKK